MSYRRLNTGARQCKAAALASFGVFCGDFMAMMATAQGPGSRSGLRSQRSLDQCPHPRTIVFRVSRLQYNAFYAATNLLVKRNDELVALIPGGVRWDGGDSGLVLGTSI